MPPQRKRRSSEAKDPNHPDVETKGLNGDIDFYFSVEHRHSTDTGQTRCRTRSHHLSFLPKERKRENHPATSNCKNLPRQQNAPSEFASVPFPRGVPLGISPFLRRCRGGRRTASITAGIFPREAETDRKPRFLGPCYHHSIRRQGSHLGHPSFAIFSYSISTTPIFFPHLGQFVEKGVGTGDGKGSCYDENDRWPEKCAASSERSRVEWSGDFDLDAQNGK